jgi:hypothetical protein
MPATNVEVLILNIECDVEPLTKQLIKLSNHSMLPSLYDRIIFYAKQPPPE